MNHAHFGLRRRCACMGWMGVALVFTLLPRSLFPVSAGRRGRRFASGLCARGAGEFGGSKVPSFLGSNVGTLPITVPSGTPVLWGLGGLSLSMCFSNNIRQ